MNDKEIRKILISYLKLRHRELRIYQEKQIGGSVCDLMLVTECLTGFEIKSDLDNYTRIATQISYYDKYFDYNYVVVGESHRESVAQKVPDYWGIMVISNEGISVSRSPVEVGKRSRSAQLSLLWKLELKNLLNFFSMPMYAQKDKKYIADKLCTTVPDKELGKQIAYELINRDYSIYDAKDYTEYYRNGNIELEQHQIVELVDSISEMDMCQMTLDQWINIFREAREIQEIKEKIEMRRERPKHAITYEDIEVAPGVPWISAKIIEDFIKSLSEKKPKFTVVYEPITGNWFINYKKDGDRYPEFTVEYGIKRYNALFILEALLNLREIKIFDSRRKYDEESTIAALEKKIIYVLIYRYINEGSFDAYSWQILESKQRFISQFLSGSAYQRSADDLEENVLNYAEVKALALSNPRMKDLAEKENRLANLRILSGKYKESIDQIEEDIKLCEKSKIILQREIAEITDIIPNISTKSEKEYKLLRALCQKIFAKNNLTQFNKHLGSVWGFELETTEHEYKKPSIYLVRNDVRFLLEVGDTALGNATRVSHFFEKLPLYVEELKDRLAEKERQIKEYNKNLQESNPYIVEIKQLDAEVRNLKREIYETRECS